MTEIVNWLASLSPQKMWALFGGLLLFDGGRYTFSKLIFCIGYDHVVGLLRWRRKPAPYLPKVAVLLSAYNEASTLSATIDSIHGTYPFLEIIVVDDGSTDGTTGLLRRLKRKHNWLRVITRPCRSGKASSVNLALNYTRAEVLVVADTDSHLSDDAIYRIVQPFRDRNVGAVSATLHVRNPFESLVTWCQSFEYLNSIFVGRQLAEKFDMLVVASGGFSAFRRTAVERIGGWDVGPGEDGDITLRLRKAGYRIAFARYAECFTNVPSTWKAFYKQRRRWNRGSVRYKCRKHLDLAFFWYQNFRVSNLLCLVNCWVFQIGASYAVAFFWLWILFTGDSEFLCLALAVYLLSVGLHLLQALIILVYSRNPHRDALVCLIVPVLPLFNLYRRIIRLHSMTEEFLLRRSYDDHYVPSHVRSATWVW